MLTALLLFEETTWRIFPVDVFDVSKVASASSGIVKTLLFAEEDGACKLKDPPPDAAFNLIFAVIYAASNAATFVSNTSILATASCNAAVSKGTSLLWSIAW